MIHTLQLTSNDIKVAIREYLVKQGYNVRTVALRVEQYYDQMDRPSDHIVSASSIIEVTNPKINS